MNEPPTPTVGPSVRNKDEQKLNPGRTYGFIGSGSLPALGEGGGRTADGEGAEGAPERLLPWFALASRPTSPLLFSPLFPLNHSNMAAGLPGVERARGASRLPRPVDTK